MTQRIFVMLGGLTIAGAGALLLKTGLDVARAELVPLLRPLAQKVTTK